MFWGLIMEPNKRYSQVVETSFHISQAALDISTGDGEPCQVMIVVDNKNFLACTLQKNKHVQVPLDYNFKAGSSVSFLTNGKCNVHLTGYLDEFDYGEDEAEDEEDSGEEEAKEEKVGVKKRKMDLSEEPTNKKIKHDQKADASAKSKKKAALAKADSSESDDDDEDDEDNLEKLLNGDDMSTDENDESYKANMSAADTSMGDDDSDEEESDNDEEEEASPKKKKASSSDADTSLDTSKDDSKVDMSKLSKSQKRRLKKKLQKQGKEQQGAQTNGVAKAKKPEDQQKPDKEKKKPKSESEGEGGDKKEKKVLSGGVSFEDLKVGNGPVAKSGKVVVVYYEGRLKQNNKVFDQCQKGPGFKFRLGAKEVISGWDLGIVGMKVGGKRKVLCPPAMAYGAKGNPPVIPPNSTLVFEVELKSVK